MNDVPTEHDWVVAAGKDPPQPRQVSSCCKTDMTRDDTMRGLRRADFADFIHFGKAPAEPDRFNKTVYEVQRPYAWAAPSTPP